MNSLAAPGKAWSARKQNRFHRRGECGNVSTESNILARAIEENDVEKAACVIRIDGFDAGDALTTAILKNNPDIVKLLLHSSSFDTGAKDHFGYTALTRCIDEKNETILKILIDSGLFDPNQQDGSGTTPLTLAIAKGNSRILKLMLSHPGIDVNKIDGNGYTPLTLCAQKRDEDLLRILYAAPGLKEEKEDSHGKTAKTIVTSPHEINPHLLEHRAHCQDDDFFKGSLFMLEMERRDANISALLTGLRSCDNPDSQWLWLNGVTLKKYICGKDLPTLNRGIRREIFKYLQADGKPLRQLNFRVPMPVVAKTKVIKNEQNNLLKSSKLAKLL